MSGAYGQAMSEAAGAAMTLLDHSQEKKLYNQYYDAWGQTYASRREAESAEQANLLNLTSMYNTQHNRKLVVGLQQDDAEAIAKVSAAAAGVEGGSVDMVGRQTRVNQSLAVGSINRETEIKKLQYIENAGAYRSRMMSSRNPRKTESKSPRIAALTSVGKVVGSQEFGDTALRAYDKMREGDWWNTTSGVDKDGNIPDVSQRTMESLF